MQEPDKTSFYKAFFTEDIYVLAEEELSYFAAASGGVNSNIPAPKKLLLSGSKMAKSLLLFNYPQPAIPEADKNFLNQVLKAVNLSLETVCWLNAGTEKDFNWDFLQDEPQVENIITFGFEDEMLPEKLEEGKIHIYHAKKMLRAGKLADIALNKNQKKLLWDGLKNMFNL